MSAENDIRALVTRWVDGIRACDLDAVTEDPAAAVLAGGRHRVRRALEAVERAGLLTSGHGEGLVVVVAAGVARGHRRSAFPEGTSFTPGYPTSS